jgi:hypothetical protein
LESNSPASSFTTPVMGFCCPKDNVGISKHKNNADGKIRFSPVRRQLNMCISNCIMCVSYRNRKAVAISSCKVLCLFLQKTNILILLIKKMTQFLIKNS